MNAAGVQVQQQRGPVGRRRSGPRSKSSPFIGVTQYKRTGRFEAHVWIVEQRGTKGHQRHLGSYAHAEDAARCYDRAVLRLRGLTAQLNFPVEEYAHDPFILAYGHLEAFRYLNLLRAEFALRSDRSRGGMRARGSAQQASPIISNAGGRLPHRPPGAVRHIQLGEPAQHVLGGGVVELGGKSASWAAGTPQTPSSADSFAEASEGFALPWAEAGGARAYSGDPVQAVGRQASLHPDHRSPQSLGPSTFVPLHVDTPYPSSTVAPWGTQDSAALGAARTPLHTPFVGGPSYCSGAAFANPHTARPSLDGHHLPARANCRHRHPCGGGDSPNGALMRPYSVPSSSSYSVALDASTPEAYEAAFHTVGTSSSEDLRRSDKHRPDRWVRLRHGYVRDVSTPLAPPLPFGPLSLAGQGLDQHPHVRRHPHQPATPQAPTLATPLVSNQDFKPRPAEARELHAASAPVTPEGSSARVNPQPTATTLGDSRGRQREGTQPSAAEGTHGSGTSEAEAGAVEGDLWVDLGDTFARCGWTYFGIPTGTPGEIRDRTLAEAEVQWNHLG